MLLYMFTRITCSGLLGERLHWDSLSRFIVWFLVTCGNSSCYPVSEASCKICSASRPFFWPFSRLLQYAVKGIVHLKIKILLSFTQLHMVPNLHDLLSFVGDKSKYDESEYSLVSKNGQHKRSQCD